MGKPWLDALAFAAAAAEASAPLVRAPPGMFLAMAMAPFAPATCAVNALAPFAPETGQACVLREVMEVKGLWQRTQVKLPGVGWFTLILWCVRWCSMSLEPWLKDFSQRKHLWGFSPVWMRVCTVR